METDTTVAAPQEGQDDAQPDDTALEDYQVQDEPEVPVETTPEPPVPSEPVQPTVAELIQQSEARLNQQWQSWTGRRDKDLLEAISRTVDQKLAQTSKTDSPTTTEPSSILDDPDGWVERKIRQTAPKVMYEEAERATTADRNYTTSIIQNAGQIMDNDPLFADKVLGNEVIQEIQTQFGRIDKRLPPDINARLLINSAVTNIYRKRVGGKTNALAGNTGVKTGVGGVSASASTRSPVKIPKLSPDAQKLAQRWHYKEEDLARVFKDS